jgi:hypothetical protein
MFTCLILFIYLFSDSRWSARESPEDETANRGYCDCLSEPLLHQVQRAPFVSSFSPPIPYSFSGHHDCPHPSCRNSYSEFDPFLVGATCLYLAAKVEECTTPAKVFDYAMRKLSAAEPRLFPS